MAEFSFLQNLTDFRKKDIEEIFGITSADYNDLTRKRFNRKGLHQTPFFVPLFNSPRGQGYDLTLTFSDLMLLMILIVMKKHNLDRSIGRFLRELCISQIEYKMGKNKIPVVPNEITVWNSNFDDKDPFQWTLKVQLGWKCFQRLTLARSQSRTTESPEEIAELFCMISKEGIEKLSASKLDKAESQCWPVDIVINLNEINRTVKQLLKKRGGPMS